MRSNRRRLVPVIVFAVAIAGCGSAATTAPNTTSETAAATGTAMGAATPEVSAVQISTLSPPTERTLTLDLVDTSRTAPDGDPAPLTPERELPTTIYLPPDDAQAPLIVLAHGFAGHPDKFTELASHWADAGYVVAVPRFPLSSDETPNPSVADIAGQAGDVSFVIDQVLARSAGGGDGPLAGRVDPERIGLFGLSLGSLTVWNTVLGDCCDDDRVDALIQSDGFFPFPHEQLADLPFPVMIAHSDTDFIFDYGDIRAQLEALPESAVLLTLHNALHATVAENTDTPADVALQDATTVFWNRSLGLERDAAFPATVVVDGVTSLEGGGAALPTTR